MAMKRGFFGKLAGSGIRSIVDRALNLRESLPLGRSEEAPPKARTAQDETLHQKAITTPPARHALERAEQTPSLERAEEELRWAIPQSAIDRASVLLSGDRDAREYELTLSIIVLTADEEARVERDEQSFKIEPVGRKLLPRRPAGAKSLASIGLSHEGRFASITHLPIDD